MEEIVVVETFDRYHRVRDRIKLASFPATIGRSYDNDIILDDPYVSPHHARIERTPAGQVLISDMQSVNGMYDLTTPRQRADRITVEGESRVRLGRTLLRIRTPHYVVAETRVERLGSVTLDAILNSRTIFFVAIVLFGAIQFADAYLLSYEDRNAGRVFFDSVLPILGFILGWAGLWALLSRLNYHQSYFYPHGTIVSFALLAIFTVDFAERALQFGLGGDPSGVFIESLKIVAFAFPVIYAHMRFVSHRSPRRVARFTGVIVMTITALFFAGTLVYESEFASEPQYSATLLPANFQFVPSKSLDAWGEHLMTYKQTIQKDIERTHH